MSRLIVFDEFSKLPNNNTNFVEPGETISSSQLIDVCNQLEQQQQTSHIDTCDK